MTDAATPKFGCERPQDPCVSQHSIVSSGGGDLTSEKPPLKRGPADTTSLHQNGQASKKLRTSSSFDPGQPDQAKPDEGWHRPRNAGPSVATNRGKVYASVEKRRAQIRWDPRAFVVSDKEVICRTCKPYDEPGKGAKPLSMHDGDRVLHLTGWFTHCGRKTHQMREDEAVKRGELPPKKYLPARFNEDSKSVMALRAAQSGDDRNPDRYPDPLPRLSAICPTLLKQVPAANTPPPIQTSLQPGNQPTTNTALPNKIYAPTPTYSPLYFRQSLDKIVKITESLPTSPAIGICGAQATPPPSPNREASLVTVHSIASERSMPIQTRGKARAEPTTGVLPLVGSAPDPARAVTLRYFDTVINSTESKLPPPQAYNSALCPPGSPDIRLERVEVPDDGPNRRPSPDPDSPFSGPRTLRRTASTSSITSTGTTGTVNTAATAWTTATSVSSASAIGWPTSPTASRQFCRDCQGWHANWR